MNTNGYELLQIRGSQVSRHVFKDIKAASDYIIHTLESNEFLSGEQFPTSYQVSKCLGNNNFFDDEHGTMWSGYRIDTMTHF